MANLVLQYWSQVKDYLMQPLSKSLLFIKINGGLETLLKRIAAIEM